MLAAAYLRIPLYRRDGSVAEYVIIDAADAPLIAPYRWHLGSGYARRSVPGEGALLVHRVVMGLRVGDGLQVDHINRDKLDCRKKNLRVIPQQHNAQNVSNRLGTSSRFRGVYWCREKSRWRARVKRDGRYTHLGYFDSEVDAALAADRWRLAHMPFAQPDPELSRNLSAAA